MALSRRELLTNAGFDPRWVGRIRWLRKVKALRSYDAPLRENLGYLLFDPEVDNFTYDIENKNELAHFLAKNFGVADEYAASMLAEAESNDWLNTKLYNATSRRWSMKTSPALGRRLGWYAMVRIAKPEAIVETGIHDGLGSLALLAAIDRNSADGVEGQLTSFDIDRTSGWIVGTHPRWTRVIESTSTALVPFLESTPIQMFLHDSAHDFEHEKFELTAAARAMDGAGVLMSDNSHVTTALAETAREFNRPFDFFAERPQDHFYPGGGIGLSVAARSAETH